MNDTYTMTTAELLHTPPRKDLPSAHVSVDADAFAEIVRRAGLWDAIEKINAETTIELCRSSGRWFCDLDPAMVSESHPTARKAVEMALETATMEQERVALSTEELEARASADHEARHRAAFTECESCLGSGSIEDTDENGRKAMRKCLDCRGSGEAPVADAGEGEG